ncbi:MAG: PP2C family protein-serine/threonine phosphatase [Candidatus Zixiibacteriota bacterium]|nr:MAG: PP2C family protein-serine/threonine phosphatase [candidate division Zixibacteria bacterium]
MPSISEKEFFRLKHAVDELSALNQIANAINVSMSIDKITRVIVDRCLNRVKAAQGAIFLLGEDEADPDKFKTFVRKIDPGAEQIPYRLNVSLTGWMIKNKQILLSNDPQSDERFSRLDFSEMGIRSILSAPLLSRSGMIGVLALFNKSDSGGFTDTDKRFAGIVATQTAKVIENARLFEKEQRLMAIEEEIAVAKSIQQGFLPDGSISIPSCQICGFNLPAKEIGGDYFDIVEVGDNTYFLSLGDVSGKGVPAALLMANAQAVLRAQLRGANETMLPGMARSLNHLICQFTSPAQYITAIFGLYNAEENEFKYINAGHLPPVVVRRDGTTEKPEKSNLVIGVMPEVPYLIHEIKLMPGELLYICTDGVTEAEDTKGQQFEYQRLEKVLCECRGEDTANIGNRILGELGAFRGDAVQSDDITMLIVKAR